MPMTFDSFVQESEKGCLLKIKALCKHVWAADVGFNLSTPYWMCIFFEGSGFRVGLFPAVDGEKGLCSSPW